MWKNYLLIALRVLRKNRLFSLINIAGLAGGLAIGMLIILVLGELRSYDRFHPEGDRLYRVITHRESRDRSDFATTPLPVGDYLRESVPGVEAVVRLRSNFGGDVVAGEETHSFRGLLAEAGFFELFGFELLAGQAEAALVEPWSLVLTEEAIAQFGWSPAEAVGQVVQLPSYGDFQVTGVLRRPPGPTHIKFGMLASYATVPALEESGKLPAFRDAWWSTNDGFVYLRLAPETRPRQVEAALAPLTGLHYEDPENFALSFGLQAMYAITPADLLENDLSFTLPKVVMLFLAGLALLVLLTAGFNYTGLTIARSLARAREVGVRKVLGAHRGQIFAQFVAESVVTALLALVLAWVLLEFLIVPQFKALFFNQYLDLRLQGSAGVYLAFMGFALATGVVAGLLPAGYLSAFRPVRVLRPITNQRIFSKLTLRKGLVIVQFTLALVLFISVTLLYDQTRLMLNANYGFDKANLAQIHLAASQGRVDYARLRPALIQIPGVLDVSGSQLPPAANANSGTDIRRPGQESQMTHIFYTDGRFAQNLGMTLVAGRYLQAGETGEAILLNETGMRRLGFAGPAEALGQVVELDHTDSSATAAQIVGILADFHYQSLTTPIQSLVVRQAPERITYANVRLQSQDMAATLAAIEAAWQALDPVHPLPLRFQDEIVMELINLYYDNLKVVGFICGIALLIACLGLLGTATFQAESRVKEVGIRKILGASTAGLTLLLSRTFFWLLLVAALIGIPGGYAVNQLWLQQIAHRVSFGWTHVVIALGLLLLVGVLTILTQTWRAARRNPVEALRYE